jgi:hypothetical protein
VTDTPEIFAALSNVMRDLRAVAKRDRQEQAHYLFRGVDAVVNAVGPVLRDHSVLVIPQVQDVAYEAVKTSTGKPSTACRVTVEYVFIAPDGSQLTARVIGEAWDSADKAAPKAMAVAWRTALIQALALPTDDVDPDAPKAPRSKGQPAPKDAPKEGETRAMSRPQRTKTPRQSAESKMFALFKEAEITEKDAMLAFISDIAGRDVTSRTDLSDEELGSVVAELQLLKGNPS